MAKLREWPKWSVRDNIVPDGWEIVPISQLVVGDVFVVADYCKDESRRDYGENRQKNRFAIVAEPKPGRENPWCAKHAESGDDEWTVQCSPAKCGRVQDPSYPRPFAQFNESRMGKAHLVLKLIDPKSLEVETGE